MAHRLRTLSAPVRARAYRNCPARQAPPEIVRKRLVAFSAENYWDMANRPAATQAVPNLGTVGTTTNMRLGSIPGVDSGDPSILVHDGTDYFQMPGTAGNYLSIPNSADVQLLDDFEIEFWVRRYTTTAPILARVNGGDLCFLIAINSSFPAAGAVAFAMSNDGTTWFVDTTSTADLPAGFKGGILITRTKDDGVIRFWTKTDETQPWVQLGADRVLATGPGRAGTVGLEVGARNGGTVASGPVDIEKFAIRHSIGGPNAVFVTAAGVPASAQTWVCPTGQTVTANRSTSGHKTAIVKTTIARFAVDDYLETATPHESFDPALGDFTAIWIGRQWATPTLYGIMAAHRSPTGGWYIANNTTSFQQIGYITDGTNQTFPLGSFYSAGQFRCVGFQVDRTTQIRAAITNGVLSNPLTIAGYGTIEAVRAVRIGSDTYSAPAIGSMSETEFRALIVHRGLFTAQQLADITSYFQEVLAG